MRFVDQARVYVRAGKGGDGIVAFMREKFRPFGGPAGGDGGHGGDVIFKVDEGLSTLLDFQFRPRIAATDGAPGRGKQQNGRAGRDAMVRVPAGTLVFDEASGELVADLVEPGRQAVVAAGGRGGLGNVHFASSTVQAPRVATPGKPGEERWLRLELRLIAQAGLVGPPNAGKSSLLAALTEARPRVASYPFTTVSPNLGRVFLAEERGFTLADIPGLIEGAHLGRGLGIRFLRHLARTRVLVYVFDLSGRPQDDLEAVRAELAAFDRSLLSRPAIGVLNKLDLVTEREARRTARELERKSGLRFFSVSALRRRGLQALVGEIAKVLTVAA